MNLNAHYTTNAKVERPFKNIANGPNNLPQMHLYNDIDASKKMGVINNDIYNGTKQARKKDAKTFWKIFGGFVLAILGYKGIQKLISIFK